jgi:hypothetical protein
MLNNGPRIYKIHLQDPQIIQNLNNGPRANYIDMHDIQCVQRLKKNLMIFAIIEEVVK